MEVSDLPHKTASSLHCGFPKLVISEKMGLILPLLVCSFIKTIAQQHAFHLVSKNLRTTHISVFTLNYGKMVKKTSEHTCTELGVGSLGCGVLSGLDFLAAGCCLDVLWRFLVCELLFVVI